MGTGVANPMDRGAHPLATTRAVSARPKRVRSFFIPLPLSYPAGSPTRPSAPSQLPTTFLGSIACTVRADYSMPSEEVSDGGRRDFSKRAHKTDARGGGGPLE